MYMSKVIENKKALRSLIKEQRAMLDIEFKNAYDFWICFELEPGIFGTSHPKNSQVYTDKIDLVIVPGLAFDHQKYRLGYGGGYYDTFLSEHTEAYTVGVCYPFQYVVDIPKEEHDACLHTILYQKITLD